MVNLKMPANNLAPEASDQLYVPIEWTMYGHELAAQEDEAVFEDEVVAAAAYDEQVERVLYPVIRRNPPKMSRAELDELKKYIETEHQLRGISIRRAISRGARQLRAKHNLKRI